MRRTALTVVSGIVALLGVAVLLRSPLLGLSAAHEWLVSKGSSDTQQFMVIMSGYVDAYRLLGAIMAFVGLLGSLHQLRANPE